MADPKISMALDQTALATAFATTILNEMEGEQRDRIISQAIAHVIEPRDQGYGRGRTSILEDAFNRAVDALVNRIAADIVNEDPAFADAVRTKIQEAMASVLADDTAYRLRDELGPALIRALYSES